MGSVLRTGALVLLMLTSCRGDDTARSPSPLRDGTEQRSRGDSLVSPGRYIVVLRASPTDVARVAAELTGAHGFRIDRLYRYALQGFAAGLSEAQVVALRADPRVRYVEPDVEVTLLGTQGSPPWGLDRVDQRDLPLDQRYDYGLEGQGVNVYVLDTGIRTTHLELTGRAFSGFDAIGDGNGTNDCHGHGTHVAGTIGGVTYGVAKSARLHAVRVLGCNGSGTTSQVIAGIDWVTANHAKPAVANMSLGGGANQALDDAVAGSVDAGVVYVVAAGNEDGDACNRSPARAPSALTTGATDSLDRRASFSNRGTCLDVFAPGVGVLSASNVSDTASTTKSGTSMASPHVAGAAALYLEQHPTATPQAVANALLSAATLGRVTDPGSGSPNRLLFTGCAGNSDTTPPTVTLLTPSSGATVTGTVTLSAGAQDEGGLSRVEFLVDGELVGYDVTAPYELAWDSATVSNRAATVTATAVDLGCNRTSSSVVVTVDNPGNATYDAALGAPRCALFHRCDTVGLLGGRANLGPEPNAPNTLRGGCADGAAGTYHASPSLDRLRVVRADGTPFAVGKEVQIEATVWAGSGFPNEALDLYYAPDVSNPSWTFLTTLHPSASGRQTLTARHLLPVGSLQALRGNYRVGGSASTCSPGSTDDRDDLVFDVRTESDATPPSTSITAPAAGSTVQGTVAVTVAASDDFGVTRVELLLDGSPLMTLGSPPYTFQWDTRFVPNGSHVLKSRAYDFAGNVAESAQIPVTIDNDHVPPTVSINAPSEGGTVRGDVLVQVDAADDRGVSRVELYVNGSLLAGDDAAPWELTWFSRQHPNGTYTLVVMARDAAGNQASASVAVSTDNDFTPPVVSITSPAAGSTVSASVLIQADVSDDRALGWVELYDGATLIATDAQAPFEVSWDTREVGNGAHSLRARAFDAVGNTADAVISVTVYNPEKAHYDATLKAPVCDTVASSCDTTNLIVGRAQLGPEPNQPNTLYGSCPDGTWGQFHQSPSLDRLRVVRQDGTRLAVGKRVRVEATVWANTSMDQLDLYYTGDVTAPSWTYLGTFKPAGTGTQVIVTDYILPAGPLQAIRGAFRFGDSPAPCNGAAWNESDDLVFAVAQETDGVVPSVAITSPANGSTVSGTVGVSATAEDDFGVTRVELYVDSSLLATDTTAPYEVSWNTREVTNGSHSLVARAYDFAGNMAASHITVTTSNDFTPPTTAISGPSNGATVSGSVTVSVSASDDRGVTRVELHVDGERVATDTSAPYSFTWDSRTVRSGSRTLVSKAYDAAGNEGTSTAVTVTVRNEVGRALYDPTLKAPSCIEVGHYCDSFGVLDGRAYLGPEPNQPNTLHGSCADGTFGSYHSSGSLDRIKVIREDGSLLAEGKRVKIEATVWVWSTLSNHLDLYYTSDAISPSWQYLTTLRPAGEDQQVLTAEYILPPGRLQAIRGNFRNFGSTSPCSGGNSDDRDDLVFEVAQEVDTAPPSATLTAPSADSHLRGNVSLAATSDDDFGVWRVDFRAGEILIGSDSTPPFTTTWNSASIPDGAYVLTARAYDLAGNEGRSVGVPVRVDNTRPEVALTKPRDGETVSLMVTLEALASDNVSVTQVDFYDGSRLIGSDTTAPYGVTWNTLLVPKGSHTLTAVARDPAGNTRSSAPVTVTVQ